MQRYPGWLIPNIRRGCTVVNDPIHGPFIIGSLETQLVNTAEFRRLAGVKQLLAGHLWPTAHHTRYEHSLGVFYLARQAAINLWMGGYMKNIPEHVIQEFLIASLLHDIGHHAFSHTFEGVSGLLPHEKVGRGLIERGEIASILIRHQLSPESVADFIDPPVNKAVAGFDVLRSILSGFNDVDKGDYVSRDALYTGLPYHVEITSIIQSLHIKEEKLLLDRRGAKAVRELHELRNKLYAEIYWNPHIRSYSQMITRAVQDALLARTISAANLQQLDDKGVMRVLQGETMPISTRKLIREFEKYEEYQQLLTINGSFSALLHSLDDSEHRRRIEEKLALEMGMGEHLILLDLPRRMGRDETPLVLDQGHVSSWRAITGEEPGLPRWPELQQTIRILVSPSDFDRLKDRRQELVEALMRAVS